MENSQTPFQEPLRPNPKHPIGNYLPFLPYHGSISTSGRPPEKQYHSPLKPKWKGWPALADTVMHVWWVSSFLLISAISLVSGHSVLCWRKCCVVFDRGNASAVLPSHLLLSYRSKPCYLLDRPAAIRQLCLPIGQFSPSLQPRRVIGR